MTRAMNKWRGKRDVLDYLNKMAGLLKLEGRGGSI